MEVMLVVVPGVILAGGRSRRMGRAKAFLPVGTSGETFVSRLVRILRDGGVDDVLVVAAGDGAVMREALRAESVLSRLVLNSEPDRGQLSSLQVGLRAIDHPGVWGMLVTLVDVPLVSAETVRALLEVHRRTRAPVVRPIRHGRHGHPVIFDRAVFDELRKADPSVGAKAVVRAHEADAVAVEVDDEGAFLDIDTPDDYKRVFKQPVPDELV